MDQVRKDQINTCPNCGKLGTRKKGDLHAVRQFDCRCGNTWTATASPQIEGSLWNIDSNHRPNPHEQEVLLRRIWWTGRGDRYMIMFTETDPESDLLALESMVKKGGLIEQVKPQYTKLWRRFFIFAPAWMKHKDLMTAIEAKRFHP